MIGRYLKLLFDDWQALVSGVGSFVLAGVGAMLSYSWSPAVFWPLAYICLAYSGFRIWSAQVAIGDVALYNTQNAIDTLQKDNF